MMPTPTTTEGVPTKTSVSINVLLRIIIRHQPETCIADAYGSRGIAMVCLGNNNLGCRDARKACELGNC